MNHYSTRRICTGLRLCPTPLPRSLRGISFQRIALLEWYAAEALGLDLSILEWMREVIGTLTTRNCWFCGASTAGLVGEVWSLEVAGGRGKAVLEAIRPTCRRCLLVLEAPTPSRAIVERLAMVNGLSRREAEAITNSILALLRTAESIHEWEITVEAQGLEKAAIVLEKAYKTLNKNNARLRGEWLVKGIQPPRCPLPLDPGLLIEVARMIGAEPSPQAYMGLLPSNVFARTLWVARIPVTKAKKAVEAILSWDPSYTEAAILAAKQQQPILEIPLEIHLPCYDQLQYHQEALELLSKTAHHAGSPLRAELVIEAAGTAYSIASKTIHA